MAMRQIKRYRFTCDGDVVVPLPSFPDQTAVDRCREETVVEAPDKWEALRSLPEGWRAVGHPTDTVDVRCPAEHHEDYL